MTQTESAILAHASDDGQRSRVWLRVEGNAEGERYFPCVAGISPVSREAYFRMSPEDWLRRAEMQGGVALVTATPVVCWLEVKADEAAAGARAICLPWWLVCRGEIHKFRCGYLHASYRAGALSTG